MIKSNFIKISKKIGLVFFLSIIVSSCSVKMNTSRSHISGSLLVSDSANLAAKSIAEINNQSLERYKRNEWNYNKADKNSEPKLCLALSGGGIRSASFSIGVLKGLREKGVLDKVDIMSAVSGGSYALSWYYMQQYKYGSDFTVTDELLKRLKNDETRSILKEALQSGKIEKYKNQNLLMQQLNSLLKRPLLDEARDTITSFSRQSKGDDQLFTNEYLNGLSEKSRMYGFADMLGTTLANIVMVPFNFIINGLFTGNVNTTSQRAYYERAIKRTFHSSINEPFLTVDLLNMESIEFNKINDFIKTNNLPYFIINTSADIDDDRNHFKSKLRNSVFEFTPTTLGSDGFGYGPSNEYSIGLAVSVSGAALDSTEVPGKFNSLLGSALNMDLGFYIENYHPDTQKNRLARKLTPFPLYYFWMEDPHRRDQLGMDIYLTDGGHTENLGAYSLIKRSCEHIIIVDAEYDDKYEFEGYHHLKNALLSEMQLKLNVPGLVSHKDAWINNSKVDAVETGVVKNIIALNESGGVDYKDLKVTYIKLAINDALIAKNKKSAKEFYGEDLLNYYNKSKSDDCGQWIIDCQFPQYTTSDQSYSPDQFKAYIDLGYSIVRNSDKIPDMSAPH